MILWVMARQDDALTRHCQFNTQHQTNDQVKFIVVGAMLCGEGFDEIILDNIYAEADKRAGGPTIGDIVYGKGLRLTIDDWVRESLMTRLNGPNSKIRELVDYAPPKA